MNFVLELYAEKDTHPFDIQEMRLIFARTHSFYEKLQSRKSPAWRTQREFVYDNGITGVYFTLHYKQPDESAPTEGKYTHSGLTLEMELPRASFFGYESMRVMAVIMKRLNLLASRSSHPSDTPEPPKRYSYDELVEMWMKVNQQEVIDARQRGDKLYYADRKKLLYWWRYTAEVAKLKEGLAESDTAVPEVVFYAKKGSNDAVMVCEWRDFCDTLLPAVDCILLRYKVTRPTHPATRSTRRGTALVAGQKKMERGLALFNEVVEIVEKYCTRAEKPVPRLICSLEKASQRVMRNLQGLILENVKKYHPLMPDELVDALPGPPESQEVR